MIQNNQQYNFVSSAVLPDGAGGFVPCPELLTPEEAVLYLRMDTIGHKNPLDTLRYYRSKGRLKGTKIGKGLFYTRKELDRFMEIMTRE